MYSIGLFKEDALQAGGRTMRTQFLIFDHVEELDLVGPWELIGSLAKRGYCEPPVLVSLNTMTPVGEHRMRFNADARYTQRLPPDVVIIPGGRGAREAMNEEQVVSYVQWLGETSKAILSVCTGSILLQKAGLLRGLRATTHWAFLGRLRDDPDVTVLEKRFVRDGRIWTSAGVSAGIDMTLAYIADTFGEAVAAQVQLDVEYFPAGLVYGAPFRNERLPGYIRRLHPGAHSADSTSLSIDDN